MANWAHPDRLDRISATGSAAHMAFQVSAAEVQAILSKGSGRGGLARLPRKTRDRNVVLAALCLGLHRRRGYTELEVNDHLRSALRGLGAEIDHATCRRQLVDVAFLKRNRTGARYLLDYPRVVSMLSAEGAEAVTAFVERLEMKKQRIE